MSIVSLRNFTNYILIMIKKWINNLSQDNNNGLQLRFTLNMGLGPPTRLSPAFFN